MRTHIEADITRGAMASQAFADRHCGGWPATYRALLPVTSDGALLIRAKLAIETQMNADVEAILAERENPWTSTGPDSTLIDWSGIDAQQVLALGLEMDRPLGMPAAPKQGFHEHPDVVSAGVDSHRTAEYIASIKERRAWRAWEAASDAWKEAANSGADEATVRKSKDGVTAAAKAHAAAEQDYDRLRKNPAKGLKLVRDPLTEEQRIEEKKSAGIK